MPLGMCWLGVRCDRNSEVAGAMNLRSAYLLFPAPSIYDTAVCQLTVTKARDALPPVGTESDNG